jgi:hypothetical protein
LRLQESKLSLGLVGPLFLNLGPLFLGLGPLFLGLDLPSFTFRRRGSVLAAFHQS